MNTPFVMLTTTHIDSEEDRNCSYLDQFIDSAYSRQTKQIVKESDEKFEKEIHKWMKENRPNEFNKQKYIYLKEEVTRLKKDFFTAREEYKLYLTKESSWMNDWIIELMEQKVNRILKQIKSCEIQIDILQGKRKEEITPAMIERAREYPLTEILHVDGRSLIKCLEHDEKTPSMSVKNNFAYCFGCGYNADSISVYRKVNGVSFKEAVISLQ